MNGQELYPGAGWTIRFPFPVGDCKGANCEKTGYLISYFTLEGEMPKFFLNIFEK